jgi:hypothetical protein
MNMLDYWEEPHYEKPLHKHIEEMKKKPDAINHPEHYGGSESIYEAIKVIDAWKLDFCLGNVIKYISRAGKKGSKLEDLRKAQWYLNHEIKRLEGGCF